MAEVILKDLPHDPQERVGLFACLPMFQIEEAEPPWLKCQKLNQWKNGFYASTSASSINYGTFAKWAFQCAERNIKLNALTNTKERTRTPEHGEKYEARMRSALMNIVPKKVLEKTLRTDDQTSVDILVELIDSVTPGIRAESESLKTFTKNPGTAATAGEAEEKLMHWQIARKRMSEIGLGELSTLEIVEAFDEIVREVATTDAGFGFRYQSRAHQSMAVPSMEEAKALEDFLERELADFSKRAPATPIPQGPLVIVSALQSQQGPRNGAQSPHQGTLSPQHGAGSPQPGTLSPQNGVTTPQKKKYVCSFWRAGRCAKGENCDWLHQEPAAAQGEGGQGPGTSGDSGNGTGVKRLCRWIKKNQVCYGIENGKCQDRHEVLDTDAIAKIKIAEVVGAPSSAKALDVAVIEDPAEFQVLQGMRVVAAFDSADGAL